MKFQAAILETLGEPLVLGQLEAPPLECGQVLVQIHRSGICGAQLNEIAGTKGPDRFLPHLLGHEGGGVVVATGPGVTSVRQGDHVVLHWRKGAGIHAKTAKYDWDGRTVNSGWVTTFSQYAVVSENRVTPIPKDVPFEIAALLGCAVTTALGLINNLAQLKIGQSIAIFGCGGVGLNVVQGAALVAAQPIIAIDIYDHKLDMAREFGATHLLNSTKCDVRDEIRKIVGSQGVDVFVENTGLVRLIETAYELTGPKGRHDPGGRAATRPKHQYPFVAVAPRQGLDRLRRGRHRPGRRYPPLRPTLSGRQAETRPGHHPQLSARRDQHGTRQGSGRRSGPGDPHHDLRRP